MIQRLPRLSTCCDSQSRAPHQPPLPHGAAKITQHFTRFIRSNTFAVMRCAPGVPDLRWSPVEFTKNVGFREPATIIYWMHDASDSDLLREFCLNGSESAFEKLVARHISIVYSAAHRQVRDVELFGVLSIGPKESPLKIGLVVDEPEGKPARLFVDANANGDLRDDPAAAWTSSSIKDEDGKEWTHYNGGADVLINYGKDKASLHLAMYRFDKRDPARAALKDALFYYSDYAREGEVTLGGQNFRVLLADHLATGDFHGKDDN